MFGTYEFRVGRDFFDQGTNYEIECEYLDPEIAKKLLKGFLEENRISFSNSNSSKFVRTVGVYCSWVMEYWIR